MSPITDAPANEFADLAAEHPDAQPPLVQRRWVAVPNGGHVSAVVWHAAPPELVVLHDAGASARSWDAVLLALGRPVVALDLPGHGRSSWRDRADYRPKRNAAALTEAVRSFKASGTLVAGRGLGALSAIALASRAPGLVGTLVLVDTLPGSSGAAASAWPAASPAFDTREAARDWLARRSPGSSAAAVEREAFVESAQDADGKWAWRHHLGTLPDGAPRDLDDETLWEQLASIPGTTRTVLLRAGAGALDDEAVERFRTTAANGEAVTLPGSPHRIEAEQPEALAAALRDALG
jgi:pimeloyl-ACP methyl ester carboxylesterase